MCKGWGVCDRECVPPVFHLYIHSWFLFFVVTVMLKGVVQVLFLIKLRLLSSLWFEISPFGSGSYKTDRKTDFPSLTQHTIPTHITIFLYVLCFVTPSSKQWIMNYMQSWCLMDYPCTIIPGTVPLSELLVCFEYVLSLSSIYTYLAKLNIKRHLRT